MRRSVTSVGRAVFAVVACVAAGCAPTSGPSEPTKCEYTQPFVPPTPSAVRSPSGLPETSLPSLRPTSPPTASTDVVIKLSDLQPTISGLRLNDSTGAPLVDVNAALTAAQVTSIRPVFGSDTAGDLGGYVRVATPSAIASNQLVATVTALDDVVDAYRASVAAPPPTVSAPAVVSAPAASTPCLASGQSYFGVSPDGLGIEASRNWPGATGANVSIVDVEYSWNVNHEDLSAARAPGALLSVGVPSDPFGDSNHGTAVIGILRGDVNSYGINGIVPAAQLRLANAQWVFGYQGAAAVAAATAALHPGDVIVIEQQAWGLNGDLVPSEWVLEFYDAIKAATDAGINVVEAAANGGVNLDSPAYGPGFPAGRPDSGAIMVGAGASCGSSPERSRLSFSNYGVRVNVQAEGECVTTSGYGNLINGGPDSTYTAGFNGTSSATALMGGVTAALSSAWKQARGTAASPATIRNLLVASGVAQNTTFESGHIGPRPNLAGALALIAGWVE